MSKVYLCPNWVQIDQERATFASEALRQHAASATKEAAEWLTEVADALRDLGNGETDAIVSDGELL